VEWEVAEEWKASVEVEAEVDTDQRRWMGQSAEQKEDTSPITFEVPPPLPMPPYRWPPHVTLPRGAAVQTPCPCGIGGGLIMIDCVGNVCGRCCELRGFAFEGVPCQGHLDRAAKKLTKTRGERGGRSKKKKF